MEFKLARDVRAGEEVTIYYGNPTLLTDKEVKKRRRRLQEHYHFECLCSRCASELSGEAPTPSSTSTDAVIVEPDKARDPKWEPFLGNSEL